MIILDDITENILFTQKMKELDKYKVNIIKILINQLDFLNSNLFTIFLLFYFIKTNYSNYSS